LCGAAVAQEKPNIVLVFMDNFGWGEPGFNGGGVIRGAATPRIDDRAAEILRQLIASGTVVTNASAYIALRLKS